jgi:hypothetical protein
MFKDEATFFEAEPQPFTSRYVSSALTCQRRKDGKDAKDVKSKKDGKGKMKGKMTIMGEGLHYLQLSCRHCFHLLKMTIGYSCC